MTSFLDFSPEVVLTEFGTTIIPHRSSEAQQVFSLECKKKLVEVYCQAIQNSMAKVFFDCWIDILDTLVNVGFTIKRNFLKSISFEMWLYNIEIRIKGGGRNSLTTF